METRTIEVRCNARPTRLGFVLPSPDNKLLLEVICTATNLWGGLFDPVLILDGSSRIVRGKQEEHSSSGPYLGSQSALLQAFDPDFLITFSADPLPVELAKFQHRTFTHDRLEWQPWNQDRISYFLEVWPALQHLWEREFKFSSQAPPQLRYLEKPQSETSAFLAARFGMYASGESYDTLSRHFGARAFQYDTAFKLGFRPGMFAFPISLSAYGCSQRRQQIHSHAYFLLDPTNAFDVIDYWNLRAAGMMVLPLTFDDYKQFETAVREFGSHAVYPINEKIMNHPVLIKGRSIEEEQVAEVADWIRSLSFLREFSTMGWVPRFSANLYRVGNDIAVFPVTGAESSRVGVLADGYGAVDGPTPPFRVSGAYDQHWSMDLSFFSSSDLKACYHIPWLNPQCDALVSRRIGHGSDLNAGHASKRGLVTQHRGDQSDIRIWPITPTEVIKAYLNGVGIKYDQTSSSGLMLERIIEQIGGISGADILQNPAVRDLVDSLSTGKPKPAREVRGLVQRSIAGLSIFGEPATTDQIKTRTETILSQAVQAKIFRIGLVFQCSRCKRRHWYAVSEFNESYNCKSCFARESTPRLDSAAWHYISDGFYRSSNKLDGNIAVLLALHSMDHALEHRLHYIPSFDYSDDCGPHEMDFGIISSPFMGDQVDLIFGEVKSSEELSEEERRKATLLATKTGAYLCFCTLRDDFSDADKAFFRQLVESKAKIILLAKEFLEMDYFGWMTFRNKHGRGWPSTEADWLWQITIPTFLGADFAQKNEIWL
jgi:hypothetical protein